MKSTSRYLLIAFTTVLLVSCGKQSATEQPTGKMLSGKAGNRNWTHTFGRAIKMGDKWHVSLFEASPPANVCDFFWTAPEKSPYVTLSVDLIPGDFSVSLLGGVNAMWMVKDSATQFSASGMDGSGSIISVSNDMVIGNLVVKIESKGVSLSGRFGAKICR